MRSDYNVSRFQCPDPEPLPPVNHSHLVNWTPSITRPSNPHSPAPEQEPLTPSFFWNCPSLPATSWRLLPQTWGNKPLLGPLPSLVTPILPREPHSLLLAMFHSFPKDIILEENIMHPRPQFHPSLGDISPGRNFPSWRAPFLHVGKFLLLPVDYPYWGMSLLPIEKFLSPSATKGAPPWRMPFLPTGMSLSLPGGAPSPCQEVPQGTPMHPRFADPSKWKGCLPWSQMHECSLGFSTSPEGTCVS